jgi:A/G-specific adenine glycosylase
VHGAPLAVREAETLGDTLVPTRLSWEFNQTMFDLGATVCTGRSPSCERCPLRGLCAWERAGLTEPDPWRASPSVRRQSTFAGSDRQGRGRLLDALRAAGVRADEVPEACGWPDDAARAQRIAAALVAEGFARWSTGSPPVLSLC